MLSQRKTALVQARVTVVAAQVSGGISLKGQNLPHNLGGGEILSDHFNSRSVILLGGKSIPAFWFWWDITLPCPHTYVPAKGSIFLFKRVGRLNFQHSSSSTHLFFWEGFIVVNFKKIQTSIMR